MGTLADRQVTLAEVLALGERVRDAINKSKPQTKARREALETGGVWMHMALRFIYEQAADAERLAKENGELRAALEKIAKSTAFHFDCDCDMCQVSRMAKTALAKRAPEETP